MPASSNELAGVECRIGCPNFAAGVPYCEKGKTRWGLIVPVLYGAPIVGGMYAKYAAMVANKQPVD